MVLSTDDFRVWTHSSFVQDVGPRRMFGGQSPPDALHPALLQAELRGVRQATDHNSIIFNRVAELRKNHNGDTTLEDLASYDDERVLQLIDRFATAALIQQEWADDVRVTVQRLQAIKDRCPIVWRAEDDCLLAELRNHLENLIWVAKTMQDWSDQFGHEYDRRHPDLPPLPFTPTGMGNMDSSRLPPVL